MSFDKMISIFLSYILAYISYICSQKKIFWVSNSSLTQILVSIYHISFQRTFCVKLREQACMSGNGKFWSGIKWSVKQLLSRTKIFNDHLWKFGTKNSVFSQFIPNGSNRITRGKFSGRCLTKEATFFKSYWKHCKDNVMNKFHKSEIFWMRSLKLLME